MLRLNLLPPAERENLAFIRNRKQVTVFGQWLIIILVSSAILFWTIGSYIGIQSAEYTRLSEGERSKESFRTIEAMENDIRESQKLVQNAAVLRGNRILWSQTIPELAGVLPTGMRLSSLAVDSAKGEITLLGRAENPDGIIASIKAFEGHPFIAKVDVPPSNWLRQSDIDFKLVLAWKSAQKPTPPPSAPEDEIPIPGEGRGF
ncbi:MAG: hypothetical protein HY460_00740 [Parcubacteria group bacterium]|nr:hypothetical protein [Parcubacteria group bacterium]